MQPTLWKGSPWSWVAMPHSLSLTVPTWTRPWQEPWHRNLGTLDRWVLWCFPGFVCVCILQKFYSLTHLFKGNFWVPSIVHPSFFHFFSQYLENTLSARDDAGVEIPREIQFLASRNFLNRRCLLIKLFSLLSPTLWIWLCSQFFLIGLFCTEQVQSSPLTQNSLNS